MVLIDPDGRERAQILLDQDNRELLAGTLSPEKFRERQAARGKGALFAITLLIPGPEELLLAAAGKAVVSVLGKAGGFLSRFGGKLRKAFTRSGDARDGANLSKQARKGIRSTEKRIAEHEAKLADFKANPTPRPGTENLSKEIQQKSIDGRITKLENEIQTFRDNIQKLRKKD
jgi:hypothetical protein